MSLLNHLFRCGPIHTLISHRHTVFELGEIVRNTLIAADEITFNHETGDGFITVRNLFNAVFKNQRLFVYYGGSGSENYKNKTP